MFMNALRMFLSAVYSLFSVTFKGVDSLDKGLTGVHAAAITFEENAKSMAMEHIVEARKQRLEMEAKYGTTYDELAYGKLADMPTFLASPKKK